MWRQKETKRSLEQDRRDIMLILKKGVLTPSRRTYLEKQLQEVERKLAQFDA